MTLHYMPKVYTKSYEHGFCFVGFCHGLVPVDFVHILQGYFFGTGETNIYPSASEATLKNIGKYATWINLNW